MLVRRQYNKTKDKVTKSLDPVVFMIIVVLTGMVLYSISVSNSRSAGTAQNTDKFGRALKEVGERP